MSTKCELIRACALIRLNMVHLCQPYGIALRVTKTIDLAECSRFYTSLLILCSINPIPTFHDKCCLPSHLLMLMYLSSLYCKQYGPRSDCS